MHADFIAQTRTRTVALAQHQVLQAGSGADHPLDGLVLGEECGALFRVLARGVGDARFLARVHPLGERIAHLIHLGIGEQRFGRRHQRAHRLQEHRHVDLVLDRRERTADIGADHVADLVLGHCGRLGPGRQARRRFAGAFADALHQRGTHRARFFVGQQRFASGERIPDRAFERGEIQIRAHGGDRTADIRADHVADFLAIRRQCGLVLCLHPAGQQQRRRHHPCGQAANTNTHRSLQKKNAADARIVQTGPRIASRLLSRQAPEGAMTAAATGIMPGTA